MSVHVKVPCAIDEFERWDDYPDPVDGMEIDYRCGPSGNIDVLHVLKAPEFGDFETLVATYPAGQWLKVETDREVDTAE